MPYFPIFQDLTKKKILIVGSGGIVKRKIRLLMDFTNNLTVITHDDMPEENPARHHSDANSFEADDPQRGFSNMPCEDADFSEFIHDGVKILSRRYSDDDLKDVDYCVASTEDSLMNHHIALLCRNRGIPVNVPDAPEWCSFYLPAVVRKGELVIAVSTSGKSPAMAAKLCDQIEDEMKSNIEEILDCMGKLREWLPEIVHNSHTRSRIYHCVLNEMMEDTLQANEKAVHERVLQIIDEMDEGQ